MQAQQMLSRNWLKVLKNAFRTAHRSYLWKQAAPPSSVDKHRIGVAHLRRGLTIFASQGRIHRMRAFGQRAIDELKARNLNAEAEEIANLLNGNLPKEIPTATACSARGQRLPTHCPSCGAAVQTK